MTQETRTFQAEVAKLLQIVANSLYSRREVFLRELISNASDACDRLRYEALTAPELAGDDSAYRVVLRADTKAKTLTIEDNGIGMSRDELIANLGTIARSGSSAFLDKMAEDGSGDLSLIGQFGVGFYSAFVVADRVEVTSRRAGASESWCWSSDGAGEFTIADATRERRGTAIVLHLKKDARAFLDAGTLRATVKAHSDHIGIPVVLAADDGDETLNSASALWTRPKSDITA
ncbi:MAG: ATP-binding protein, partial [Proteobacteria bacterium]|nr:ATP-binding protein [Pseudomonadota bacterium]